MAPYMALLEGGKSTLDIIEEMKTIGDIRPHISSGPNYELVIKTKQFVFHPTLP